MIKEGCGHEKARARRGGGKLAHASTHPNSNARCLPKMRDIVTVQSAPPPLSPFQP